VFNKNKPDDRHHRLAEEQVYEMVLAELEDGQQRPGIWAKALADSDGSGDRARSLYIKYRAQSMIDEMSLEEEERDRIAQHQKKVEAESTRIAAVAMQKRENELRAKKTTNFFKSIFLWFCAAIGGLCTLILCMALLGFALPSEAPRVSFVTIVIFFGLTVLLGWLTIAAWRKARDVDS